MPDLTDDIDEALLDLEIALLAPSQLDVAYRSLCANMLCDSIHAFRGRNFNQCHIDGMAASRQWFQGGGVITFAQACEMVDIPPSKIIAKVNGQKRCFVPINAVEDKPNAHSRRPTETAGGLVPGGPALAAGRRYSTGAITSRGGDGRSPLSCEQDRDRGGRPARGTDAKDAVYKRGWGVA